MNDDTIERLGRLYTSAVHDVLRGLGHERCVLPPSIRPIEPGTTLCGRAWTVAGHVDRTRSADETLLAWTGVLSKAPSGHVVVCQPNNDWIAMMGELSANALKLKGVLFAPLKRAPSEGRSRQQPKPEEHHRVHCRRKRG